MATVMVPFLVLFGVGGLLLVNAEEMDFKLSGNSGSFASPNYPNLYPHNFTARWTIRTIDGSSIQLDFKEFDIERNKKCLYDYIVIGDAFGNWSSRLCNTTMPFTFVSPGSWVEVVFVSDSTMAGRGFSASWRAISTETTGTNRSASRICSTKHILANQSCYTQTQHLPHCRCTRSSGATTANLPSLLPTSNSLKTIAKYHDLTPTKTHYTPSPSTAMTSPTPCVYKIPNTFSSKSDDVSLVNRNVAIMLGLLLAICMVVDIALLRLFCIRSRSSATPDTRRMIEEPNICNVSGNIQCSSDSQQDETFF